MATVGSWPRGDGVTVSNPLICFETRKPASASVDGCVDPNDRSERPKHSEQIAHTPGSKVVVADRPL